MLKLNKTTEYGLMAISYIRGKTQGELTSAREIADHFNLPFEILAKTLQRLKDQGVIASTYGTRGGYVLARDLKTLNLADFLGMMEGPVSVVACATPVSETTTDTNCAYTAHCRISGMMRNLNDRVHEFLHRISIEELTYLPSGSRTSQVATNHSAPAAFIGDAGNAGPASPAAASIQGEEP